MNFRHTQNVIFVNSDASCGIFKGSGRIYIIPPSHPLFWQTKLFLGLPSLPLSLLHFWINFLDPHIWLFISYYLSRRKQWVMFSTCTYRFYVYSCTNKTPSPHRVGVTDQLCADYSRFFIPLWFVRSIWQIVLRTSVTVLLTTYLLNSSNWFLHKNPINQ